MVRRRTDAHRVFLPWERRRGAFGVVGRARARLVVGALAAVTVVVGLRRHEETLASIRATRASIDLADQSVAAYRADHAGSCPRELGDLVAAGYARDALVDAWGRPLRLVCPGVRDPRGFDVYSDGPDGLPGGIDRIE
jgi:general secretion pathway protein G